MSLSRSQLRVCFVGDSLTTGVGDKRWQSWPQRLCTSERARGYEITPYNLGVRGETSADIRNRWQAECRRRLIAPWHGGIVFAFGVNDTCDRSGCRRVPFKESIEHAKAMVTQARDWRPTFWIGPAPVALRPQPLRVTTAGVEYRFRNERIAQLTAAFQAVAADLATPFLDLYGLLNADPYWAEALHASDGVHPVDSGYRRLAEVVRDSVVWRDWVQRSSKPLAT